MESSDTGIYDNSSIEHTGAFEIREESLEGNSYSYSKTKGLNEKKNS